MSHIIKYELAPRSLSRTRLFAFLMYHFFPPVAHSGAARSLYIIVCQSLWGLPGLQCSLLFVYLISRSHSAARSQSLVCLFHPTSVPPLPSHSRSSVHALLPKLTKHIQRYVNTALTTAVHYFYECSLRALARMASVSHTETSADPFRTDLCLLSGVFLFDRLSFTLCLVSMLLQSLNSPLSIFVFRRGRSFSQQCLPPRALPHGLREDEILCC